LFYGTLRLFVKRGRREHRANNIGTIDELPTQAWFRQSDRHGTGFDILHPG
jgi:hypothetical protein